MHYCQQQHPMLQRFRKYFYSLESLKGLDDKDLLEKIKSDENISNIITYHNIYKILKLLLLPDTIVFVELFTVLIKPLAITLSQFEIS